MSRQFEIPPAAAATLRPVAPRETTGARNLELYNAYLDLLEEGEIGFDDAMTPAYGIAIPRSLLSDEDRA